MIYLQAPWDLIQTTTMLPNPALGNTGQRSISTIVRNTVNGTFYSYNKTNSRKKFVWDFTLRRGKAEELKAFLEVYYGIEWRVTDWNDDVFKMVLVNDPVEITFVNKTNLGKVRLELEGVQLNV